MGNKTKFVNLKIVPEVFYCNTLGLAKTRHCTY